MQPAAPKARREATAPTVHFIALLRALGMVVDSHGVSHAQIERKLCERIAAGDKAEDKLNADPPPGDAARLRTLINRKAQVVDSGLARGDGRRDRAGGQRIGELLAGKFPRNTMPSRRRVEVCVDVFLEVLEDKDPTGYAEDRYGTRQLWFDLWLEADQGRLPRLQPPHARTVAGYLDIAFQQLVTAIGWSQPLPVNPPTLREASDHGLPEAPGPNGMTAAEPIAAPPPSPAQPGPAPQPPQTPPVQASARPGGFGPVQASPPHRSATPTSAVAAGGATPGPEDARGRASRLFTNARVLGALCIVLAVALAGALLRAPLGSHRAPSTLILQFPQAYPLSPGPPGATIPLDIPRTILSAGNADENSWAIVLHLRLMFTSQGDSCVHDSKLSYTITNHGSKISTGALEPGQADIVSRPLALGTIQDEHDVRILLTAEVGKHNAGCQFTLDPSGTIVGPADQVR